MNENLSFERFIADHIERAASGAAPHGAIDDILTEASRMRPRPRWLALIKEPPMRISSHLAVGSPTARVVAIMVATLLLAITVAGAGIAGSRLLAADGDIVVDPSGIGTVTTITAAVARAEDGDTILVKPGTYDESVVITKDITIRGDGDRDQIVVELSVEMPPGVPDNAPDLPFAFLLEDSDATLETLTLRGESARMLISGGAPLLQDLVLDGVGRVYALDPGNTVPGGLEFNDGATATIRDSVLTDTDIDIETGSSPTILGNVFSIGAIWMQGTGVDPVIRDNVIDSSVKWGISIGGGAKPTVEANTIIGAQNGIDVQNRGHGIPDTGTDPVIRDNTISGSFAAGITVGLDTSATIVANELLDNGIAINVFSDALVEANNVEGGGGGIIIAGGESPTLIDNSVGGVSGRGIVVARGASPTLSGNTSCNNGTNLVIGEGATPVIDDTNEICADAPVSDE